MSVKEKLRIAEEGTNTDPTEAQKEDGNYKKGKVTIKTLKITIENPVGSTRSGIDKDGNEWSSKMLYTYGYFNGTVGKDDDPIDVFIGPKVENDFDVYIVDQVDEDTRAFDEHKVMFGFDNKEEAKEAYLSCYEDDWKGLGQITTISLDKFKEWIKNEDAIKWPASKLSMDARMELKSAEVDEDKVKSIKLTGEVFEGETLLNLQEQAGDIDDFDTLVVEIASPGGSVSEGLDIMVWLNELSAQGKMIVTVVVANAYSIASLIMLAADMKLISKHGEVMVHNPMVPQLEYVNANDLEEYTNELRKLEALMYEIYQAFTGLEKDVIKSLMDNETYLSADESVESGFADTVIDIKPRPFEVATNIKKEVNMLKTLNILNKVIGMVNKSDFVNQLYYDAKGGEIEIFQKDPSTYAIGDRTSVEAGEVKIADGSKLIIEDYVISDINKDIDEPAEEPSEEPAPEEQPSEEPAVAPEEAPAEEPAEEEPAAEFNEGPAPEEEISEIKSKSDMPSKVIEKTESTITTKETVAAQISQVSKWESEVINDTFEIGTKVEYMPFEDGGEPVAVGAGEWELEDGSTVLTDAEGIIRYVKPAPAPEAPAEEPAPEAVIEAKEDEPEAIVEAKADDEESEMAKMKAEYEGKIEGLENSLKELKDDYKSFEKKSLEAFDAIANNISSGFKPDARASVESSAKKTIFQTARAANSPK